MSKSRYLFHFIVSGSYNKNIEYLKEKLNFNKNSELFGYIFDIISKNISNIKGIIGNHESEYTHIDTTDVSRVDKYLRLNKNYYKMLKKWHYLYNEYSMSAILRDIIRFFYDGIIKYGVNEFVMMISKKLNIKKINDDLRDRLTQLLRISIKKSIIFSHIIENLQFYT